MAGLSHMDFGELGQDADEKAIVPTCPLQLAAPWSLCSPPAGPNSAPASAAAPGSRRNDPSGFAPDPRCGPHPVPGAAGSQSPMSPHNVVEPFRRTRFTQQVVAALFASRAILLTDGGDFAHCVQARPVMRFLQPGHIGADAGNSGFNTPVSLADLDILGQRRGRVVQKQLRIIPQTALIALQSQGVVAVLLNHLLRHLPPAVQGIGGSYFAPKSQHFQQPGAAPQSRWIWRPRPLVPKPAAAPRPRR